MKVTQSKRFALIDYPVISEDIDGKQEGSQSQSESKLSLQIINKIRKYSKQINYICGTVV